MWLIELGLRTYFILKRDRFVTTSIFTGSASTVHNSFKVMFQNFTFFGVIQAMLHAYMLISAAYSVFGIRSYFSCSKTPELG